MTEHPPPRILDDAELLGRSRRSAVAFRAFYDRHVTALHAFLLRRTRDPDAAFALTAETFAAAWLSRERFVDRGDGAAPWLFGIARNLLASSVRSRAIEASSRRRVGLDVVADLAAPDERWLDDLDEALAAALASLPDGQRQAVELRVLDEAAYDEVALRLAISPGAARVRVHRGLAALRRSLTNGPVTNGPVPLSAPADTQAIAIIRKETP